MKVAFLVLSLFLPISVFAQEMDNSRDIKPRFSASLLVVKFAPGQQVLARQLVPGLTAQHLEQATNGGPLLLEVAAPTDAMNLARQWFDLEQVQYASPVILNEVGEPAMAYTDRLVLRTNQPTDLKELAATLADFGLTQVERYAYEAQTFVVQIPKRLNKLAPPILNYGKSLSVNIGLAAGAGCFAY
jgi:hypothetical protein